MTAPREVMRALRNALARAEVERGRAERAAEIAERHERQLLTAVPRLREYHRRLASMHWQVERQHAAAAAMHAAHGQRLRLLADNPDRHHALPGFMVSVAEAAHAGSAAVTLFGPDLVETLTVGSDGTARAAQDLEFTLGEGPARDTMSHCQAIHASGAALGRQWPTYGPAIERLGIRAVAAVPVQLTGVPLGAMTFFDPAQPDHVDELRLVADTVAAMLVPLDESAGPVPGFLLAEADHRAVVHQATGILSVQRNCAISDALALIRARAFADDRTIESVATDIVQRTLRLT
jgi:hypothetical protein